MPGNFNLQFFLNFVLFFPIKFSLIITGCCHLLKRRIVETIYELLFWCLPLPILSFHILLSSNSPFPSNYRLLSSSEWKKTVEKIQAKHFYLTVNFLNDFLPSCLTNFNLFLSKICFNSLQPFFPFNPTFPIRF